MNIWYSIVAILLGTVLSACSTHHTHSFAQTSSNPYVYQYVQHITRKLEIIGATQQDTIQALVTQAATLEVQISINHGGTLMGVQLQHSSGNPQLDAAMIELIEYSAPYPPLPDELEMEILTIQKRWQFIPNS